MTDVLIIGGGIAGMTAAIYAARAGKSVLLFENNALGGQILESNCIQNYPGVPNVSGYDLMTNLFNQMKSFGVEVRIETVINLKDNNTVITNKDEYKARTIIVACGLEKRKLNLRDVNGISYCATCDGSFYKNKVVALVGGGDTALDDGLYLSNIVKKLYVINRSEIFRGNKHTLDLLKEKLNVEFILNSNVVDIIGNEKIEGIVIENKDGNKNELEVTGLFIAIGQEPSHIFKNLEVDKNNFIKSENTETNISNIFVAGDVRTKELRQLITAASDGALAATKAINYLNTID